MQETLAASADALPWTGMFAAATGEYDQMLTDIEGDLPAGLRGTLYRVGPGRHDVYGYRNGHLFDGDGMVHAFSFDPDGVRYRNRYVRTPWFRKEERAQRALFRGFATQAPGGLWRNFGRRPKNPANTNTLLHAGRLLAMWEGGRPFALDPETLETRGEESFGGAMPGGTFFSAHPHIDPRTGDLYNIGPVMGPNPAVRPWKVDAAGKATALPAIPTGKPYMMHDFGLTARHLVLLGGPFYLETKAIFRALLGFQSIYDAFSWHGDEPMAIFVADREGKRPPRRYELPAKLVFHLANAWEEGADILVDAALYPDDSALKIVADAFAGLPLTGTPATLQRIRLTPDGKATVETVAGTGLDFPRIDPRRESQAYTFAYSLPFEHGGFSASALVKTNVRTGTEETHRFEEGCYPCEAVFVPSANSDSEEDGWVLSIVYDSRAHRSFLSILQADRFPERGVRVHLPFHIPLTFHGNWAEDGRRTPDPSFVRAGSGRR